MSGQATEAQAPEGAPPTVELPAMGDAAFGALMDALAPEPDAPAAGEQAAQVGAPAPAAADSAPGAAAPAAAAPGAAGEPAPAAPAGTPAAGADGDQGAPAGDPQQPAPVTDGGAVPATWTADAATLTPKLGELASKIEENTLQAYQTTALEEVRSEHTQYFEALEKHPRLLVGTQVPAIGREGTETLRDAADAREWQEAVKSVLVQEVNDRAGRALDENASFLTTVHASVELFQNNADLVPGTKGFDIELANRFATLAKPYELRVEGKLQGYSIPVQPIIDQLRSQVTAERTAKASQQPAAGAPAAPAAPGTPSGGAVPANPSTPPDGPQAGIPSKAGESGVSDDFSTLFGTIGLPNLRI